MMAGIISDDDAQYALEMVKAICAEVGPGLPGSAQERQRAGMIRAELESHLGAANVTVEEFSLAPGAWLGTFRVSAVLMLAGALLNLSMGSVAGVPAWLTAALALALAVVAPLPLVLEFLMNHEVVDPLFKKGRSVNVIGTLRKPGAKEVKRLLMLSGHHDSAWENTWISLLGYGFYGTIPTIFIGFAVLAAASAIQLVGVIAGDAGIARFGTLGWVMLAYPIVPAIIVAIFFVRGRKNGGTVPGAADNLSASALAVAMCRFLVKNPSSIPGDTEIWFISFGSEEAGLRGSRRYVERHLEELKRLDARLLNFETVAHPEIGILTSDVNGVKNSPEMVASVVAAAERAGVPYKVEAPFFGTGNDSGPFSRAGLKAATLLPFKMPQQIVAFYHQKRDRPEVLTIEPLLNVLKLALEWVRSGGE